MRLFIKFIFVIIISGSLVACQNDQEKISRRWVFTDLQTPSSKALAAAFDEGLVLELTNDLRKKIQGNRLILDKDGNCYGVLLNRYFTGTWDYSNSGRFVVTHVDYPKKADLKWEIKSSGSRQAKFDIDAARLQQMSEVLDDTSGEKKESTKLLDRKGNYTIVAESESNKFTDMEADPWSPALNKWRLKPAAKETDAELKKRVRNHLHFMYSFFSFAIQGERYWVSQDWFFSVIKPGKNGTALLSPKNIPNAWYGCFYDSAQAIKGLGLLRKVFYAKIDIPKESNSIVFNKLMLGELLKVFDSQNASAKD